MAADDFTVTVTHEDSGVSRHCPSVKADSERAAARVAGAASFGLWKQGPPAIPVFTLQVFDHGVEVDSNWSSLELAQHAAVVVTTETEDGANYGRNPEADDVKASLVWTHEEQSPSWRATSPEDVGFVITRAVLDAPHQF